MAQELKRWYKAVGPVISADPRDPDGEDDGIVCPVFAPTDKDKVVHPGRPTEGPGGQLFPSTLTVDHPVMSDVDDIRGEGRIVAWSVRELDVGQPFGNRVFGLFVQFDDDPLKMWRMIGEDSDDYRLDNWGLAKRLVRAGVPLYATYGEPEKE